MTIQYVGGAVASKLGHATNTSTIALNSGLTGGLASSVSAGDLVLAIFSTSASADRTLSITDGTTAYTLIGSELYQGSAYYSSSLRFAYKFMGASPDAATTFGPTGSDSDAGAMAVHVWRGVSPNTPLDVTPTTLASTICPPDPPSITPLTSGSVVVVGACQASYSSGVFTSSELSNFLSTTSNDSAGTTTLGIGSYAWSSGQFNPAQFGGGDESTLNGALSITLALRPYVPASAPAFRPTRRAQHLLMR